MKNTLNRYLSFLIVMLMIVSVSPTAFATGISTFATPIEQEYTGTLPMMALKIEEMEARGIQIVRQTDSTLISNIKNPSNGVITFDIKVPAKQTLYYAVELIPNSRTGSIDTAKNASYTNSGAATVSKTISVNVKYLANSYTISANYTTGNDRVRTIYECSKTATSALKTSKSSDKFVWTSSRVTAWQAGTAISTVIYMGAEKYTVIITTAVHPILGAITKATFTAGTIAGAVQIQGEASIIQKPQLNWAYQIRYEPSSGGATMYLDIYNASGALLPNSPKLGSISLAGIARLP